MQNHAAQHEQMTGLKTCQPAVSFTLSKYANQDISGYSQHVFLFISKKAMLEVCMVQLFATNFFTPWRHINNHSWALSPSKHPGGAQEKNCHQKEVESVNRWEESTLLEERRNASPHITCHTLIRMGMRKEGRCCLLHIPLLEFSQVASISHSWHSVILRPRSK